MLFVHLVYMCDEASSSSTSAPSKQSLAHPILPVRPTWKQEKPPVEAKHASPSIPDPFGIGGSLDTMVQDLYAVMILPYFWVA